MLENHPHGKKFLSVFQAMNIFYAGPDQFLLYKYAFLTILFDIRINIGR